MYANTGTSANIIVKLMSWLSPLHYSCELLLRRLFEGKNKEFTDKVLINLGYTNGVEICVYTLITFYIVYLVIGLAALHRLAIQ